MTVSDVLTLLVVVLVVNVVVALARVLLGPTGRDRITGVLLAGTTGSAALATVSVLTETPALRDVALVTVALAALVVIARLRSEQISSEGRR